MNLATNPWIILMRLLNTSNHREENPKFLWISFIDMRANAFDNLVLALEWVRCMSLPELLDFAANLAVDLFLEVSLVELNNIIGQEGNFDLRSFAISEWSPPPLDEYTGYHDIVSGSGTIDKLIFQDNNG